MAPGQDDPVPMSAVGVPEERSGVVATAARAAAVAAAEALSLLVAWSRAKEQLAMVMHDGFKVSKRWGGGSWKGGLGEEAVNPCPPAPAPSRLGPRPRPLLSERTAVGKTTRDYSLTRRPLRLQLPAQWRGVNCSQLRCAKEGAAGSRGGTTSDSAWTLLVNLPACGPPEDQREEVGLSGCA